MTPAAAIASAVALTVLAPIASLAWVALHGEWSHWFHLAAYVVPPALADTGLLLLGVGSLTAILGTGSAWLVTAYDFPGRRVLTWALLLPLAVPTYIVAFAYLDLLHPIGPVQGALRAMLGVTDPGAFRLPDLRSLWGAIFVLGVVLYPYVYLSTRAMFLTQAASLLEAARTLGAGRAEVFFRTALPLARPAIALGLTLVLLETLNDIGASEFLGIQTLTVAIYTTWVARSDLAGAAQIALLMLLLVIGLVTLERAARRRRRYAAAQRLRPMQPRRLRGATAWLALAAGAAPVIAGFVAPAAYLAAETLERLGQVGGVSSQLVRGLGNTLMLAIAATLVTVAAGIAVAWAGRAAANARSRIGAVTARVAALGYAVPGTVLAIGLLAPLTLMDDAIGALAGAGGSIVAGSTSALVLAYSIRFLAIPAGEIESGLSRIPASLEQASRVLGETGGATLRRVHLPLLRPALAAGALLVFVDAMKELPATLLLRPLEFETLATWLYGEAARGTYEEGAVAALAIVAAGLLPVVLLARTNLKPGR